MPLPPCSLLHRQQVRLQLQQEMLENSIQSVDTNNIDDIAENLKTDEETEEDEEIQEPSEITKEQLQSPIDLKV